ncbi:MAG: rRNA methyltransferase [Spirochaetaceae bacterium]|jgi:ribosomal protein RSM22 (predicted rRNA methylase)|nr:rRNA methyltransferase [Spirochaetaceae bacterium]
MNSLFPPLNIAARGALEKLFPAIDAAFPLKQRFLSELPKNIARLSAMLTKERAALKGGYMSDPALLHAYLRYFLPWNVFRLARLLPSLPLAALNSAANGSPEIVDVGAGPLTLPVSLWIAFPELRAAPLRFVCVDKSGAALEAGKKLFSALAQQTGAAENHWQIKTRRAAFEESPAASKENSAVLVCALNVCNELFQHIPQADTGALSERARKFTRSLLRLTGEGGRALVIEPGAPRPAQFLHFARQAFIEQGFTIEAPCPQTEKCPMHGGRRGQKWCHFNFDTKDAPEALNKISAQAFLPKEKVTLSFLLAAKKRKDKPEKDALNVRVISDAFSLPENKTGRYACSEEGLTLIRGSRTLVEKHRQGTFLRAKRPAKTLRDAKSGAFILDIEEAESRKSSNSHPHSKFF